MMPGRRSAVNNGTAANAGLDEPFDPCHPAAMDERTQHQRSLQGFPAVERADARWLILGSMPGRASLEAGEYYAHPRNAFWRILGEILGFDPADPYADRCEILRRHGVALWDVIGRCERPSSLDADIRDETVVVNDFGAFFRAHPRLAWIAFNGTKAEQSFRRLVEPRVPAAAAGLPRVRLPSTSPAHAARTRQQKRDLWRAALFEAGLFSRQAHGIVPRREAGGRGGFE
jgi:double-stranded uracil-DNA glycosylase